MATITTPPTAKTSDDSTLITHIVGMWARTTPVLSTILTRFVSETGLKSLMSDSTTLDDSNKIASSKAVKNANRRYIAENYTDGAPSTPAAGSTALGRGGKWVINGDGHLTGTSSVLSAANAAITCRTVKANTYNNDISFFGAVAVGTGLTYSYMNGILTEGQIESQGTVKGLKLEAGSTGITSTGTIESQGTVKGLKLEAGATGITSSGTIESTGTVKGLKLEAGTSGITSSGHIDAGVKQVRGANISKFTAKFNKGSSSFSLVKEFTESGFTITYPSATEIRIYYGGVSMTNFAILTLLGCTTGGSCGIEDGTFVNVNTSDQYISITTDAAEWTLNEKLILDFIY